MTNAEKLIESGYEDVVMFSNPSFEGAIIGVSDDRRAIYDYDLMIEACVRDEGMTQEEAIEWIEHNTIRSLPYVENAPIIMYGLEE